MALKLDPPCAKLTATNFKQPNACPTSSSSTAGGGITAHGCTVTLTNKSGEPLVSLGRPMESDLCKQVMKTNLGKMAAERVQQQNEFVAQEMIRRRNDQILQQVNPKPAPRKWWPSWL